MSIADLTDLHLEQSDSYHSSIHHGVMVCFELTGQQVITRGAQDKWATRKRFAGHLFIQTH
jgi:hypothetical protein